MDRKAYLERLGLSEHDIKPDEAGLRLMQYSHLVSVPFENLDIHWRRPIALDTDRFFEKIVRRGRGGFCYELNGLFDLLLCEIGFSTRLVSARVFAGEGGFGPEFDHMAIIVTIDDNQYLVDVGFGDFAAEPLRFETDIEQSDREGTFLIRRFDADYFEVAKRDGDAWKSEYIFTETMRTLSDFAEMCNFQQFSPDSHFTKGKVCSVMTPDGRKTLSDKKFVVAANGVRTETEIHSEADFDRVLALEFGINVRTGSGSDWVPRGR